MIRCPLFLPALLGLALAAGVPMQTPEQVVQRQVEAYNARDLDAFLATYAPAAQVHFGLGPDAKTLTGPALRERYGARFKTPGLHCEITGRLTLGAKVVDREHVTSTDKPALEAIAIYQVRDGLIQEAWILSD